MTMKCLHEGDCFAKGETNGSCLILKICPTDVCRFQKPEREVTKGMYYKRSAERRERYVREELPERKDEEWAKEWDEVTARLRL